MPDLRDAVDALLTERFGLGRPAPPPPAPPGSSTLFRQVLLTQALADELCGEPAADGRPCALLYGHTEDGLTDHDPEP